MPPRKRHCRSLDALFPRPKPVKRCGRGHTQSPQWRPMMGCKACALYDEASERIRNANGAKEREEWSRANPTPRVLQMRIVTSGKIIRHAIPPHLAAQRLAQDRARGRGRRRRI